MLAVAFSQRVGQHAPEMVSAVNLVAAGLGIAIVPASLQRIDIEGIKYCDLRDAPKLKAPLNIVTRRSGRSAAVRQFLTMAKLTAKNFSPA